MDFDYDLFVIGAGSGGVRASRIASQLGAKVAIVEDRYLGGTCVNVGCVPKKLFVYSSEFAKAFNDASGFGWNVDSANFDWVTLRDNKTREIERLNGVYANILDSAGVTRIDGRGVIAGPNQIRVGEKIYSAKYIVIAVGGWPRKPDFPGSEYITDSNEIFYLDKFPGRVLVQGGGYIAVEFAGIFNGLGSKTSLCYRGPLFLRGFDEEIRKFTAQEVAKTGIDLQFNTDIETIEKLSDGSLKVIFNTGVTQEFDMVLSAIGRDPLTQELGLETVNVETARNGAIVVDENFRTSEPGIYALGDVIDRVALTPVALAEGMALARHLFSDQKIAMDYGNIASAVFCQPNIATVGYTEEHLVDQKRAFKVFTSEFKPLKNTISGSEQRCMMKLLVDSKTDKVVGAHMVGPEAGEILQGVAIAMKAGATKADFDATIGIHPTSAEEFVTLRTVTREIGAL